MCACILQHFIYTRIKKEASSDNGTHVNYKKACDNDVNALFSPFKIENDLFMSSLDESSHFLLCFIEFDF